MKFKSLLTRKEMMLLAQLLNEKVSDLSWEYDDKIPSIQKKLKLFPRKERWVRCGILYVAVVDHEGADMKWLGPIVKCSDKVERPYSDANLTQARQYTN